MVGKTGKRLRGWSGVACALLSVGLELQAVGAKRHYTE